MERGQSLMSGRNFLVVGGSRGIGRGIVDRLLMDGNQVTVWSRTVGELPLSDQLHHFSFDVTTDDPNPANLPDQIQGIAYCPGSINLRSFRSLKPEVFRQDFELNVMGAIKVIQSALPRLIGDLPPSIVLFSTVAVGQGMFAHASIAASKGALEGLTRSLAAELAPKIRCNCIAPALTETSMTQKFFADDEKRTALGEKYPLKRTGTIEDVAGLAHFLLTEQSSWITGQVIGVDGGMSSLR
jgi:3-oxoacyl-[acyl-carrier protein] reductase